VEATPVMELGEWHAALKKTRAHFDSIAVGLGGQPLRRSNPPPPK
jgi:hypothetical protein